MSTSLAEQLKRLAVPQTSALKEDKKRPSLLFDPREAANFNRETLYQLGLDGLEGLKNKNPVFAQFENNLFHISSKEFERSVQSEEANLKLNKTIRKFLMLVSPYFLLYDTYKALEWLICRFRIHEYNRENYLMLILPYHETNIFVRALQLLDLKNPNDKWHWLHPLQKPGIHLPRDSLLAHAASDVSFIKFISKYLFCMLKYHENPSFLTVTFNFYCVTFLGALEYSKEVTEPLVTQMLPALVRGLKSDIPDFCAASYVITAKLVTKSELSAKPLNKFVELITNFSVGSLHEEAITLLVILYQFQKEFKKISQEAVGNIVGCNWLPKVLQELHGSQTQIMPFVEPLLKECVKFGMVAEENGACREFCLDLLDHIKFEDGFVENLIRMVLDNHSRKFKYPDAIKIWIKQYMTKIENQYPTMYDKIINQFMKVTPSEKLSRNHKILQKIFEISLVKGNNDFNLYEKLYSPVANIRKEAIQNLCSKFDKLKDRQKELLKNVLLDRLNDENYTTASDTFQSCHSLLEKILNYEEVLNICIKFLGKAQRNKEEWWKISYKTISLLARVADGADNSVFLALLPFLLPTGEDELKAAQAVINSPYAQKCPFLRSKLQSLENASTHDKFFTIVFDSLSMNEKIPDINALIAVLNNVPQTNRDALHKYLSTLLLSSALPENCPVDTASAILDILVEYLQTSKLRPLKKEATVSNYIAMARKDKFPLQGFLQCLETLMLKTQIPKRPLGELDFYLENQTNKFYLEVLSILIKGASFEKSTTSEIYQNSIKVFFNRFADDFQSKINVFLNVVVTANKYVDSELQLNVLNMINKLLNEEAENLNSFVEFKHLTMPYVFVVLTNKQNEIRELALEMLEILSSFIGSNKTSKNYMLLVLGILEHKEEIILDSNQAEVVFRNILDGQTNKGSKQDTKAIVNSFVDVLNRDYLPVCLVSGLNQVLSQSLTIDVYNTSVKYATKILNSSEDTLDNQNSAIIHYNIAAFGNGKFAKQISLNSNIWEFVKKCLSCENVTISFEETKSNITVCLLNQIDREVFGNLKVDVQHALLDSVVDLATNTQNPEIISSASHVFKKIELDSNMVKGQLLKMRDVQSPKLTEVKKKRRISIVPTADILETNDWKKGVTILEFIQDKKKITNTDILLPILFELLKKCLDFDEQNNVEYTKQLILSSILHCCYKLEGESLPKNVFNMELVVQCIRASQNPQTHHHALLVLAHTAAMLPQQVLHNIMAIFTFMGSSVLRHDDAYSFQIISKIIDTIIPILVADGTEENIANVLRVFVDAILDVPEHRRMPLYKQLLSKVGPKENLHLFLLLLFEAHVMHGTEKPKSPGVIVENGPKRTDIAASLSREFSPETVIFNCVKLVQYLKQLPDDKENAMETNKKSYLFDIQHHTPKQFRHYKYTIVTFTSNLLSSKEFVNQIAGLSDKEILNLEELFKNVIINVLTYIQTTTKIAEKSANTPQAQYWKVMLHHSFDILDSLNALLTPQMFLLVIKGLMVHNLATVRRRAMEILNSKLQHDASFFSDCDNAELSAMLPPMLTILKSLETEEVNSEDEVIVQTALLSLKLLVRLLAPKNPEKFVQILEFVTDLIKSGQVQGNILASVILCLAELCNNLKAHSISCLNKFMPALLKVLKAQKRQETPDLLLLSVVTALQKILDNIPLFLSPYLEKILVELSILTSKFGAELQEQKLGAFGIKLLSVRQKLGSVIPARVLIPSVEQSYGVLISKGNYSAIGALMDILTENLGNLKGPEINSNLPDLTTFFLNALQFRSDGNTSHEEANEVETHIIKALSTLILKLSESSFRPLYYKLYDWAVRSDVKSERVITFYSLSSGIANSLKGLFVLFAGHFLNNAAMLLDACNTIKCEDKPMYFDDEIKNALLLDNVLKTLLAVCTYDSQKFINKDRFEVLMQPIVDQIENTLGGEKSLVSRGKTLLTPCIVQFAVAAADDSLWKQMNYQILLKMRHTSPTIRLVALETLTEVAKKLGEEFLPLLPETIPFLAELLEDEEETVEQACKKAVQELEKVLGENLQEYF